jgi:hypothetical protein
MIAREIRPGVVILVREDDAWAEFLFGSVPRWDEPYEPVAIQPGSDLLCLVEDRSVRDIETVQNSASRPGTSAPWIAPSR